jgi:hypothetical protein
MGAFLAMDTETSPEKGRLTPIENITLPALDDTEVMIKEKGQTGLQMVRSEWSRIQANFEFILLEINKKASNSQKYRAAVADSFSDLQAAVQETDVRIQLMMARIGTDSVASEEETVTIWEALQRIQDKVNIFYDKAKGIWANDLGRSKGFLDDAQASFPAMATTLEILCEHYKDNMPKMSLNFSKVKTQKGIHKSTYWTRLYYDERN